MSGRYNNRCSANSHQDPRMLSFAQDNCESQESINSANCTVIPNPNYATPSGACTPPSYSRAQMPTSSAPCDMSSGFYNSDAPRYRTSQSQYRGPIHPPPRIPPDENAFFYDCEPPSTICRPSPPPGCRPPPPPVCRPAPPSCQPPSPFCMPGPSSYSLNRPNEPSCVHMSESEISFCSMDDLRNTCPSRAQRPCDDASFVIVNKNYTTKFSFIDPTCPPTPRCNTGRMQQDLNFDFSAHNCPGPQMIQGESCAASPCGATDITQSDSFVIVPESSSDKSEKSQKPQKSKIPQKKSKADKKKQSKDTKDKTDDAKSLEDAKLNSINMLSVVISTVMLLATEVTDIPADYKSWSVKYLKCIKNCQGQYPANVKKLLLMLASDDELPDLLKVEKKCKCPFRNP